MSDFDTNMKDPKGRPWIARRDLLGLGAIGACLGILTYRAVVPPVADGAQTLTAREALEMAEAGQITLIDIRRPDEWRATGIAAPAHPIDMRRPDFIDALQDVVGPDRSKPVALICARGVRSSRLANALHEAGYTQVLDVSEGMIGAAAGPGWVAANLPLKPYRGEE